MSWLWGSANSEEKKIEEVAPPAPSLKDTLGFDPNELADLSTILSAKGAFDSERLHPLAGLDKGVEYLDLEDEALTSMEGAQTGLIPSRGWSDDLCYGTGAVYLIGLGLGGAYGFGEGIKNIPANAPGKLRLNTILNHVTKRGPFLGNSAGVLAVTYNVINSIIDAVRGKHDDYNSIASGAIAGAIFKSSKGFKPMGISSILMASAAGVWCGIKRVIA
ncbi:protein transporter TIM23 [Ascoidea rubescens DSM 1968]|uniref:Mitochondrial import inner membrane translocase subunit TIM23 n=1 Tax=Ascoidea rubescens DSM 1968 TaxID=1344418 RepID=A0A1D2VC76_9ASCO|nr:mitochondrial import i [Ascoidea rubescens DSM 1968]ODV59152.1 mitochondrial import i [Ascoidea rubescens DSM 1968]